MNTFHNGLYYVLAVTDHDDGTPLATGTNDRLTLEEAGEKASALAETHPDRPVYLYPAFVMIPTPASRPQPTPKTLASWDTSQGAWDWEEGCAPEA